MHRLPPVKIQGYQNTWPEIVRTVFEKMQEEKLHMRFGPPTPDAISRMEETINWIFWLEEDERRLVWMRAEGVRWKKICWRLGCGRTKAWQLWSCALLTIATYLNAQNGEK